MPDTSALVAAALPPDVLKALEDKIAFDVAQKTQAQIDRAKKETMLLIAGGLALVYVMTRHKR